jgi:hypothetical protein
MPRMEKIVSELREYTLAGSDTTVQLTEADAERLGATPVTPAPAPDPAPAEDAPAEADSKARTVRNKAVR